MILGPIVPVRDARGRDGAKALVLPRIEAKITIALIKWFMVSVDVCM